MPRPEHVLACAFQLRRAHHYLSTMIGTSRPMQTLRAQVAAPRAAERVLRDCVDTLHHGGEFMPLDLGGGAEAVQHSKTPARSSEDPLRSLRLGALSDGAAARRYRSHVVALTGNVNEAAHRLRLHRNTVTRSLDLPWLKRWRARPRR